MTGIEALLYYVLWMIALVAFYVGYRFPLVLSFSKPANSWTRGNAVQDPGIITRASHSHANAVENLPLFAAVVLAAVATGHSEVVNGLSCYVLGARIAQTVMHLIGTSFILVLLRATFWIVQIGLIAYMAWGLIKLVGAKAAGA